MLKIKDNVDLKELEKYGFVKYLCDVEDTETNTTTKEEVYFLKIEDTDKYLGFVMIDTPDKELFKGGYSKNVSLFNEKLDELVKKLKQAGLVEEVSE